MKSTLMIKKATRFLLSAIIVLLVTSGTFAQQANVLTAFTGKWEIDMKKTDFERVRVPIWLLPRSVEIKQKKEVVVIDSKWYDQQMKQHYYTEYLPLSGSSYELILANGGKRVVSLNPNNQGTGFVLSVRMFKPDGDQDKDFTETWAMEDNGKTLTIDRKAQQANDYSIKAYYNKIK
ncbi:MAG: hypothetical protein ACHQHN_18940 [Sphingobacteriales bacterium]